jgi:hypothetical protein
MSREQLQSAGITSEQISALNLTGTQSGLVGGSLATVAAVALVILGTMRVLAAMAASSRSHHANP